MNRLRIMLFSLVLAALFSTTVFAQNAGVGYHAAPFLRISPATRQVGMGDAFTAMTGDANVMRYNIAGLGGFRYPSLATNFHTWIDDTQQGGLVYVQPFGKFGNVGLDLTYFNQGIIENVDMNFNPTGEKSASNDILLTAGYGKNINMGAFALGLGAGVKYIRQNLVSEIVSTAAVDVGVQLHHDFFSIGAAVQNYGFSDVQFNQLESPLPQTYRFGVAGYVPLNSAQTLQFTGVSDAAMTIEEDIRINAGGEFLINNMFALRGGYKFYESEVSPWAFGFGLNVQTPWLGESYTRFDYAYAPLDAFDAAAHRFSLHFTFGAMPRHLQQGMMRDPSQIAAMSGELEEKLAAADSLAQKLAETEKRLSELELEMEQRLSRIRQIDSLNQRIEVEVPQEDKRKIFVNYRINFDFNKAEIRRDEHSTLHQVAEILNTYPAAKVHVSGHTDNIGPEAYNILLSKRRVDSVMTYLSTKEAVDYDRFFMPIGYGELKPVADNSTEEGRFQNRRVEFILYTYDKQPEIPVASGIESVERVDDQTVRINLNGTATADVMTLTNPDRLVFDFANIYKLNNKEEYPLNVGPVTQARVGFHPLDRRTRVVLDLTRPVEYDVSYEGPHVYITVR